MNKKLAVIWCIKFPLAWLMFFMVLGGMWFLVIGKSDLETMHQFLAWIYVLSLFFIPPYLAIRYARLAAEKVRKESSDKKIFREKELEQIQQDFKKEQDQLKDKDLLERNNFEAITEELKTLNADIEKSKVLLLEKYQRRYASIIKKVTQEQESLRDLTERHPLISSFLKTRGLDDLDSKVFLELKAKLGNNP